MTIPSEQPISPDAAYTAVVEWFATAARELPWRSSATTPWGILVCEVMSQQTPVARVAPVWITWMERWPTPSSLAQASPADVIVAWGRLGYPRRALRLLECAVVVSEQYGGVLPHERDQLLTLPGVGPYTADAVLAFAFRCYSVVLDTNIRRVLARWQGSALPAPHQTNAERERAKAYVPLDPEKSALWNEAIMELGALVCTATSPTCTACPCSTSCLWRAAGYPDPPADQRRSAQTFNGTQREARGKIMAVLRRHASETTPNTSRPLSVNALQRQAQLPSERFTPALESLRSDGLITVGDAGVTLPAIQHTPATQ